MTVVDMGTEDFFKNLDYFAQSNSKLSEKLGTPNDINLSEDMMLGCGGCVWDAAIILSNFLCKSGLLPLNDKNILELGSGTGILGVTVAQSENNQFKKFILTDMDKLCPSISANLKANGLEQYLLSEKLVVAGLDWFEETNAAVIQQCVPLDYILIADCVYLESLFEPLLNTLLRLMSKNTDCYMTYKKRRHAERRFFLSLKKHFIVTEVCLDFNLFTSS